MNKCLPAVSTIRSWYSSMDGTAGYSKEAQEILRKFVEMNKPNEVLVCLMCDEMAIRKHVEYNREKEQFIGHINCALTIKLKICQRQKKL